MAAFVVQHQTGPHQPGEVVEITDEHEAKGVDVERLLAIRAVRRATREEAKDARPIGVPKVAGPKPMPWIDPMLQSLHVSEDQTPAPGQPHAEIEITPPTQVQDQQVVADAEAATQGKTKASRARAT